MRPIILNISGPYGVGKDTLLNAVLQAYPERAYRVQTVTTRSTDDNSDPSYRTLSPEQFRERTSQGRWIVNHQLDGTVAYGTSVDEIEDAAARGRICVHSVFAGDHGAGALRRIFGRRAVSVGLLAAAGDDEEQLAVLRERLLARAREDDATIARRLAHQREIIAYVRANEPVDTPDGPLQVFDEAIINHDREAATRRLLELVRERFGDTDEPIC